MDLKKLWREQPSVVAVLCVGVMVIGLLSYIAFKPEKAAVPIQPARESHAFGDPWGINADYEARKTRREIESLRNEVRDNQLPVDLQFKLRHALNERRLSQ